jgi:hypothetical protein
VELSQSTGFTDLGVERFAEQSENPRILARDHAIGRNRRVAQLLCYLSLMRSAGLIPHHTNVLCVAARYQDEPREYVKIAPFSARELGEGYQNAHYLPGHILLNDQDPWHFVRDIRTRDSIASLFSRIQPLPADFNRADSQAEQHGTPPLVGLIEESCRIVIRDSDPPAAGAVNVSLVRSAFQHWVAESCLCYESAAQRKEQIGTTDQIPDPIARCQMVGGVLEPSLAQVEPSRQAASHVIRRGKDGQPTATRASYREQARILRWYREATQDAEISPQLVADVEAVWTP